jgi:purine-binding chemotaxis protein CheW
MTTTAVALERPPTIRVCLFSLAGELFALDVQHARQVVVLDDYTVVPLAPAHLIGVTNLRGYVLPVVDIRSLLGLSGPRVSGGSRVLVLGAGPGQIGVAIDEVLGLEWFADVLPYGEGSRRRYGGLGAGLLPRGDHLVTLLDASKVLDALRTGVVAEAATDRIG